MTEPLWPELNPHPEHDHHNHDQHLLLLLLASPSMSEQTLTNFPAESVGPPSSSYVASSLAAANAASSNPNPPPPSSSVSATTSTSTSIKIPFRSRKIRKPSTSTEAPTTDDSSKKPRLVLRVLPCPLSAPGELESALRHLRAADPLLTRIIDAHESPVFHNIDTPFHSLARSILYQQLAFKAATSIYTRFVSLCGGEGCVAAETVLALTPQQLRQIGVSARKASYLHDLARKYHSDILSDSAIVAMDDKSLFSMLTMVKGIGAWSVHMFMIFSLHRPDVLPVGDLGVRKGVQMLYGLEDTPRPSQMEKLCEQWRPYRSVGSWYMWRLIESKGTSTMASAGAAVVSPPGSGVTGDGEASGVLQPQQPHPLMIDPIQMLPNVG